MKQQEPDRFTNRDGRLLNGLLMSPAQITLLPSTAGTILLLMTSSDEQRLFSSKQVE